MFVQSPVNFDLPAGLTPPQDILIMGATDPDDGDTITYTMSGNYTIKILRIIGPDRSKQPMEKILIYLSFDFNFSISEVLHV